MRYISQHQIEIHNIKIVKFNKDDLIRCWNANNDFLIVEAPTVSKDDARAYRTGMMPNTPNYKKRCNTNRLRGA